MFLSFKISLQFSAFVFSVRVMFAYQFAVQLSSLKISFFANNLIKTYWIAYTAHQNKTYVCTEQIFATPQFVYNKIFLNKLLQKLVAYIFTLRLAFFASKSVNYSRRSESLNIVEIGDIFLRKQRFNNVQVSSKAHCDSNNWPIWTQKIPKEA